MNYIIYHHSWTYRPLIGNYKTYSIKKLIDKISNFSKDDIIKESIELKNINNKSIEIDFIFKKNGQKWNAL